MMKSRWCAITCCFLVSMIAPNASKQAQLIYDSEKAPVRLRLTSGKKHIEVINYSDLAVDTLSLGCVSEAALGKVVVETRIESVENFDLKHIGLLPADRKNLTFSFFSFPTTEPSVQQCKELGLRLTVIEVIFADKSSWRIPQE